MDHNIIPQSPEGVQPLAEVGQKPVDKVDEPKLPTLHKPEDNLVAGESGVQVLSEPGMVESTAQPEAVETPIALPNDGEILATEVPTGDNVVDSDNFREALDEISGSMGGDLSSAQRLDAAMAEARKAASIENNA